MNESEKRWSRGQKTSGSVLSALSVTAECILVALSILMYASVYYVGLSDGKLHFQRILLWSCIALIVLCALENGIFIPPRKAGLLFVAVNVTGLIHACCFPQNVQAVTEEIYYPVLLLIILMAVMSTHRLRQMIGIYVGIMAGIAAVSLFLYFGCTVFGIIPMKHTSYMWGGIREARSFLGIYYDAAGWQPIRFLGIKGIRNMALFTEAPMYAFRLVLALLLNHLFHVLPRKCNWVLLAAVVTTFSITSVLALFVFYLICFVFQNRGRWLGKRKGKLLFLFVLAACAVFFVRLLGGKMRTPSARTRSDHLRASFEVFRDTFPLGCGTGNYAFITEYETRKQGMSMGLPAFLAMDGIFAVILCIVPSIWYAVHCGRRRQITGVAFTCAFLIMIFMTALTYNYIVWFVIVMIFARGVIFEEEDFDAGRVRAADRRY